MNIFLNDRMLISGADWVPEDEIVLLNNIKAIVECLECFNFYLEPTIYYSGDGINKLTENFEMLNSVGNYGLNNPINRLRYLLFEIEAKDWNNNKKQKTDHSYYFISGGGAVTHYINDTSISEATEYKSNDDEVAILNLISSEFNETDPIHISRSSINPPISIKTFPLNILKSMQEITSYVFNNQSDRVFNLNPKHGENGIGVQSNKGEEVSPLECNKNEAAELLHIAVGKRSIKGELYAYDATRTKFIVFKYENTSSNSYHGYHPINQREVPEDVKEFVKINTAF